MNDGFLFINNFPLKSNFVDFISSSSFFFPFFFIMGKTDGVYKTQIPIQAMRYWHVTEVLFVLFMSVSWVFQYQVWKYKSCGRFSSTKTWHDLVLVEDTYVTLTPMTVKSISLESNRVELSWVEHETTGKCCWKTSSGAKIKWWYAIIFYQPLKYCENIVCAVNWCVRQGNITYYYLA